VPSPGSSDMSQISRMTAFINATGRASRNMGTIGASRGRSTGIAANPATSASTGDATNRGIFEKKKIRAVRNGGWRRVEIHIPFFRQPDTFDSGGFFFFSHLWTSGNFGK
jgi:hypothetical protein